MMFELNSVVLSLLVLPSESHGCDVPVVYRIYIRIISFVRAAEGRLHIFTAVGEALLR